MKGTLANGNEGQSFLNEREAAARFEKAGSTEWEQTGKSLECQDKGVGTS